MIKATRQSVSSRQQHTKASPKAEVTSLIGVHLGLGALASLLPMVVFAFIWVHVKDKGRDTTAFDRNVSLWMHAHQAPGFTDIARVLAVIGSGPTVVCIAAVAVIIGLVSHKHRGAAWTLPIAVAGAGVLIECGKLLFHRPRPEFFTHLVHATGYSFPSGHSFVSMTVYGLIGYFAMTDVHKRGARLAIGIATGLLIALVGLSRVYVGVHYPTDVLAGWIGGIPWLYACILLHEHFVQRFDGAGEPVLADSKVE